MLLQNVFFFKILVTWCIHNNRFFFFFELCHRMLPIRRFSFSQHHHMMFPHKEILLFWSFRRLTSINGGSFVFLVNVYQRSITLFFRFICSENVSTFRWQLECWRWYPLCKHVFQKSVFLLLQTQVEKTLWVKPKVLPTTMKRFASYSVGDTSLYY